MLKISGLLKQYEYLVKRAEILNISEYHSLIKEITNDILNVINSNPSGDKFLLKKYPFTFNNKPEELSIYIDPSYNSETIASFRRPLFDTDSEYVIVVYTRNVKDHDLIKLNRVIIHEFTHLIDYLRNDKPPVYNKEEFLNYFDFYNDMKKYLISLNPKNRNENFILKDENFKSLFRKHNYIIDDTFKEKLKTFVYFAEEAERAFDSNLYFNAKDELLSYLNEIIDELEEWVNKGNQIKNESDLDNSSTYKYIKNKISKENKDIMIKDISNYFKAEIQKNNAILSWFKKIFKA